MEWARLIATVGETRDRGAFEHLYGHFAPRVKTMLLRRRVSDEAAEEIAQETMLAVWRKAAQFDPSAGSAAAWIYTIARNLHVDAVRKQGRIVSLDESDYASRADDMALPEDLLQAKQDYAQVQRALNRLPHEQKAAITSAYYEDRSHGEIAADTDLPLGTVKSRLRLALRQLRIILDERT